MNKQQVTHKLISAVFSFTFCFVFSLGAACTAGQTLYQAARDGDVVKVSELLVDTNPLECTSQNGSTPLHAASYEGHIDVVCLLLEGLPTKGIEGIDHSYQNLKRATALHFAAMQGRTEILELLFTSGGRELLDIQDNKGYTALHWAVDGRHTKAIEFLIAAGTNLELETNDGHTARYKIEGREDLEVLFEEERVRELRGECLQRGYGEEENEGSGATEWVTVYDYVVKSEGRDSGLHDWGAVGVDESVNEDEFDGIGWEFVEKNSEAPVNEEVDDKET